MCLLGGVSLLLGLLPLLFKRTCGFGGGQNGANGGKSSALISALSCFGGGVILATCFTHMLPEVNIALNENIKHGAFPDTGMHFAEIFVLCGFFMIYIVEEVTHLAIDKFLSPHKSSEMNSPEETETPLKSAVHAHDMEVPNGHIDPTVAIKSQSAAAATSFEASLRGFLVILALSLHAVFEGVALGIAPEERSVWYLFFAIASHKFVISFCLGMQFVSSGIQVFLTVLYLATFSVISPIGAGIGIALSETVTSEASLQTTVVTVLQGLATGTLLYVVFFEIIEKERNQKTNGLLMVSFILLGTAVMSCAQYIEVVASAATAATSASNSSQTCSLNSFDSSWTLPVQLECVAGEWVLKGAAK